VSGAPEKKHRVNDPHYHEPVMTGIYLVVPFTRIRIAAVCVDAVKFVSTIPFVSEQTLESKLNRNAFVSIAATPVEFPPFTTRIYEILSPVELAPSDHISKLMTAFVPVIVRFPIWYVARIAADCPVMFPALVPKLIEMCAPLHVSTGAAFVTVV
jgi:hypothetical protein